MKVKSKRYSEVNYSFVKPFSQNFEVLAQRGYVINPNFVRKRPQTCILCSNGDRKMKMKSKWNFELSYLFMKLFSRNLEILAPCCDVIISKLVQKDSNLYIMSTGGKYIKSGAVITLVQKRFSDGGISEF